MEVGRFEAFWITSSPGSWLVAVIMAGEPHSSSSLSRPILDSSQERWQSVQSALQLALLQGPPAITSCQILWLSTSNFYKPWQHQPSAPNDTVPSGYGPCYHFFKNCSSRDSCLQQWGSWMYSTSTRQGRNQCPSHPYRRWPTVFSQPHLAHGSPQEFQTVQFSISLLNPTQPWK